MFKRRLLSCFLSEEAFNLAKVAILALYCRYALANFQCLHYFVLLFSIAHTGPQMKFIAASVWVNFIC